MSQSRPRLPLILLLAGLPLLLAACFRDTSETLVDQPVAQALATTAPAVEAAATATPFIEVIVIDEPTATEAPTTAPAPVDEFALSATALLAQQTQPTELPAQPPATATPANIPTLAPLLRATIPPGEDCVHEIRVGDTLFRISLAYGVTVDEITRASDIANPDVISVGQKVVIPECGTLGFIPPPTSVPTNTPAPTDTPDLNLLAPTATADEQLAIAALDDSRSVLVQQAQAALLNNAQADAGFGAQAAAPQASGRSYTVQPNDSLLLIALSNNTTLEALATLNNIVDVNSLYAGQVLQLP
ncbi:MAG: LysM peptidoglycan-binding domain-containing protein [Chloroflexi bacterium]|nr:LysM peptidoglycan-binding domain-containing protein [Chloroflexota bacterium]MCY4248370.1 LysM peptidoglycan-binding domain-containing protein [Chloroflexota bacterium]